MTPRDGALVRLRVQPRASRDEIVAWRDDALRVRVTVPPVEGEANAAVRTLLARALGVAPSAVEVVRGARGRDKLMRVSGLSLADVRARLAAVVAGLLLVLAAPAAAEHLTLDPGARSLAPRPLDADVTVRLDEDGFHVGGRLSGFGRTVGAWMRGRLREGGVILDGELHGDRSYNFRLDADGPTLRIEVTPGRAWGAISGPSRGDLGGHLGAAHRGGGLGSHLGAAHRGGSGGLSRGAHRGGLGGHLGALPVLM